MTIICYLFPNWRTASLVSAIYEIPALLIVIFVMPESPIWLHSKVFILFKILDHNNVSSL